MGEDAAGSGIQTPLSHADRKRIIAELEKLPQNVRGERVDTLVAWVETARTVSLDDLYEYQEDLSEAFATLSDAVTKMIAVAPLVAPFLPLAEGAAPQTSEEQPPWRNQIDLLTAVLHHLGLGSTRDELQENKQHISGAVQLMGKLPAVTEDELEWVKDKSTVWLIRAVVYYRHKQGLKLSYSWNRPKNDEPGSHRSDKEISPRSDTAKLVEATARAFGFSTRLRTLADQLTGYQTFLKNKNRAPEYNDFAHPFRYFIDDSSVASKTR